mgnify:FL=1|jgi:hypothetical protein
MTEPARAFLGCESRCCGGIGQDELDDWRGIDYTPIAFAETTAASSKGLLADGDAVFGHLLSRG